MADGRQIALVLSLILGITLITMGATWKYWHTPKMLWSKEQATEYNDAWRALKVAATSGQRRPDPAKDPKLAAAQARYDAIKSNLDHARTMNDYTGTALVLVGLTLTGFGVFLQRGRADSVPTR